MSGIKHNQYGDRRVIIATNALELGINVPDIRAVIYVEMLKTIADYLQ
jgi:superfamily II DNA helicase RecQ